MRLSEHPSSGPAGALVPLGDQAVLVQWPDEATAWAWGEQLRRNPPPWLEDVVVAYVSVGVFYDARSVRYAQVRDYLLSLPCPSLSPPPQGSLLQLQQRLWRIPVCYAPSYAPDLDAVATATGLTPEEVIRCHQSVTYTVYAIGFVPGFPYLGYLPEPLRGVLRLATPRREVPAGSVGVAGKQTGIYPLPRPGGWHLIGRTPLLIVDWETAFFPLAVGDRVRFEAIDPQTFAHLLGRRLDTEFLSGPDPHAANSDLGQPVCSSSPCPQATGNDRQDRDAIT
jgi:inhibitor of KinA